MVTIKVTRSVTLTLTEEFARMFFLFWFDELNFTTTQYKPYSTENTFENEN